MAFKINYKFLSIGDNKNIFVENYLYDQLFIVIEVRNSPSGARAIGKKIWSTMRRHFFTNPNKESYKRFEDSLKKVNKVLDKLHNHDLSALIGFIDGKDLYLTQTGNAAAYLAHNNSIEIISQGLSEKEGNTFTSVARGEVKIGDFVVFSSAPLFQYISRDDLAKVLNASALTASLSKFNKLISTKISEKVGIIGMTFEEAPERVKETVAAVKKLPHTLLEKIPKIKIKTPKFLDNIANFIKNLFFSTRHMKSKLSRIFALIIVILILALGTIWYAKNSAIDKAGKGAANILKSDYRETAVIKARDNPKVTETILDGADIRRIENPKIYVDFSTRQSNVNPLGLLASKDEIFVFEHNKLYKIGLNKIEELATFDASETLVSATYFENQDSLIFTTKSGKLIQYKEGSAAIVETADGEFHNGIAIDDWDDRIYILDSDKNRIWRYFYLSSYDIFGSAQEYTIDNDLKDAVDLAIDGFVHSLYKDGSIDQFYGGQKQYFSIQNKPLTELDTASKIYTEDELNQIFVMDKGASQIFIYAKDLKTGNAIYNSQLVFPTISDLRDLYVDKNANKLYLLDAQKVYEVQL